MFANAYKVQEFAQGCNCQGLQPRHQEGYRHARASYEAIERSLTQMRELAEAEGVERIAMPRIGVGYGGLSWKKARAIIERVFDDWPFILAGYEEHAPRGPGKSTDARAATDRPRH